MKKTINSLQQQFLTNSLYSCAHILVSEDEGMELYATWNKGWSKMSEDDKDAKNANLQSSTILEEILRRVFSKDNPALALQVQHARTKVPEDLLGVYVLHIVREHFPQATLDVIVRKKRGWGKNHQSSTTCRSPFRQISLKVMTQ
jgi:hypothetical protein